MSSSSPSWDDFLDGVSGSGQNSSQSRKRRASGREGGANAGPMSRIFKSNEISAGLQLLYDAVATDDNLLLLVMNVMPNSDLRQLARINSDWCSMAYQLLRSRIGNRPFNLLWTDEDGQPLLWRNHFNSSLLKPWKVVGTEDSTIIQDTAHWYKLKAQHKFQDVEAIIACGNPKMEDLYIDADAEGDRIPHVKTLALVTAPIVFFSTHNSDLVGDSDSGIQHVGKEGMNSAERGQHFKHVLASLCIPKSSHFSVECISVNSDTDPNLSPSNSPRTNSSPGLSTKAIVVFQCFPEYDMKNVVEQIHKSFPSDDSISVTSVECTFTASNDSNEALIGAILVFKGDKYASSIVLDITESDANNLNPKFYQMSRFIGNGNSHLFQTPTMNCFAFLFSQCPVLPGTDKFDSESEIEFMKRFRQQFPHVPIQGLGGERPVRNYLMHSPLADMEARLAREMGQMQCKMDDDTVAGKTLMFVLLVKYPLQDK